MGGSAESIQTTGEGDLEGLHAALWEQTQEFLRYYTAGASYRAVLEFPSEAIGDSEQIGLWGAQGKELRFGFKDYGGCCSRSLYTWMHWLRLAWAANWQELAQTAEQFDASLVPLTYSLRDELMEGKSRFLPWNGDLWSVGEGGLWGDDKHVPFDDLDAAVQKEHAKAMVRCQCAPCRMLRPEADFERAMIESLTLPDNISSAAWYVQRMCDPSADCFHAVLNAGAYVPPRTLESTVEAMARRFDVWGKYGTRLREFSPGVRALVMLALSETYEGEPNRKVLLEALREQLAHDDAATEVAAELVGRVGRYDDGVAVELARLLDRSEASEQLRHSTVLGLVNLHLPRRPLDKAVRERLARESERGTQAGELARWALGTPRDE